jgi:hypothetical protein
MAGFEVTKMAGFATSTDALLAPQYNHPVIALQPPASASLGTPQLDLRC